MGNKKVLSKATRELNKTKRFAAPKNIIVDPRGQWAHPGEITRIPSDTITMQDVPYPVMAYPNVGEPQMMYPGGEYHYPGADYVDEYPQMQDGGAIPVIEDAGSYNAEGYWIPDWEAMKKQAKELNAKTVKTKNGSIIYFDSNWNVQNVDDNPQMKRGGTPKSLVKMPKPSKKGLASKKFSRSLDATNKLFTENYLFAKPKSRKRKVFDPNAANYQEGGISTQEDIDDANNAMMKARLAYAYMHSNPAAQRMVVAPDQPYDFGDGNTGTHYMASMDEYAVPLIQDVNGQLMLGDFGPESAEAMRFDNPDDAQYFAEHYKEITPDESYRKEYPEEDYIETELTPEEIEEYRRGGFIVEDISVPTLTKVQDGGVVELDGYQFKQDAQGNWKYTSGAPVTDRALIQRLTYEAKPVGKPVVQAAPKVTPTPIRTQQVASKKNSPLVADQKEYKQAQQEQQQYDFNQDMQQAYDAAIAKTKLQSVQPADWVFAAPMFAPMALEGLGALAATQIPGTGVSLGTVANTVGGIHGVTQIPQRVQDWQDVAAGKKDWREATAESLMTGLELYGGLSELRALKGVPRELPGSPNNSLELGRASRTIGGDQMPDNKWLPKQEHEWFNPENKKLHDELTASLEEQAKRSEELSNFDAAAAMDKINESKLGPGVFRNLIMGDDLLWKTEEYLGTPYIPYTRRDLLREGNKLYPRVQYKPMDLETKSKLMQDITLGKSHERLLPAQQMLKNLPKWTGPIDPKTFAMEFRGQILGPTGKPITIENIEKASPRQLELWKQQVIDNYTNEFRDAIRQQEQAPKFIPKRSNLNLNREGGIVMELSDSEIEEYKNGGWIVEEL
jgi:hypothetical protein